MKRIASFASAFALLAACVFSGCAASSAADVSGAYAEESLSTLQSSAAASDDVAPAVTGVARLTGAPSRGDLNGDGAVTIADASMTLAYYAQNATGTAINVSDAVFSAADVDDSGTLTLADARYILIYYATAATGATPDWAEILEDPDMRPYELLDEMTLEEKIYQLFFVSPETLTGADVVTAAGETTQAALERYSVGGLAYFAQNLVSREQTTQMLENVQTYAKAAHGIGVFTGVDEEGGRVARCAQKLGTTKYSPMRTYGDAGETQTVNSIGKTLAEDLLHLGFNVDFAPVADVITNPNNTEIGDRSFGTDPQLVSDMVAAEVRGMTSGGLIPTLKHFPGLGSTVTDSHDGLDKSTRTLNELKSSELRPFAAGISAGAPLVMVGHMTLESIDNVPSSLSEEVVTGILREYLGFDGVVLTDALGMGAITSYCDAGTAAVMALQAGCDMLLGVTDMDAVYDAISAAVVSGELTESRINQSVVRILKVKLTYGIAS